MSPSRDRRSGTPRARRGGSRSRASASREGSPRTGVAELQRARLLGAAARIVGELGYGGMTVARVTARAGVSRRTFYELFEDREDCFLALFDDALARATSVARDAAATATAADQDSWRERVRAGLSALLEFVDDQPALGSLLVVDALGAGPRVLERRADALQALEQILDEGPRGQARSRSRSGGRSAAVKAAERPPALTAEGVVGAVLSVIHARLLEQGADRHANGKSASRSRRAPGSLLGLLNPLMGMIVLPYLGRAAAAAELAHPAPKAPHAPKTSKEAPRMMAVTTAPADPLEGLAMRLTYRTLRVLSAIASHPGASNRHIADTADVHDQGQISKLLARLERLGLIHNTGQGHAKGAPNAWNLTTRGHQVEQSLRL
jgi:AcrR family transcriptional regulator